MTQLDLFLPEKSRRRGSLLPVQSLILIAAVLIFTILMGIVGFKLSYEVLHFKDEPKDRPSAGIHLPSIEDDSDEKPGTTLSGSISPLW